VQKQKPLPPSVRLAVANAARLSSIRAKSDMTMTSRTTLVEKILWKTVWWLALIATDLRQQRILRELQKLSEISDRHTALRSKGLLPDGVSLTEQS